MPLYKCVEVMYKKAMKLRSQLHNTKKGRRRLIYCIIGYSCCSETKCNVFLGFAWMLLYVNTITWKISCPAYVMWGPFLECPNNFATILNAFESKYRKQKVVQLFGCKTFVYDED